jgi:hypothetical protein
MKVVKVPGAPTIRDLFTAAQTCLGRELEGTEIERIRHKYAHACPPDKSNDNEIIRPEKLHHNWMEMLKERSAGGQPDLFTHLFEGKQTSQLQSCATIQGVNVAALKGIQTQLQHDLAVRAWLNTPAHCNPSDLTLYRQYLYEIDAEVEARLASGQISDADSFKDSLRVPQHAIVTWRKRRIKEAQAKKNARCKSTAVDTRTELFRHIRAQISTTHIGHISAPVSEVASPAPPLILTAPEPADVREHVCMHACMVRVCVCVHVCKYHRE